MYIPVKPIVLKKNAGDKRPQFGPAFIAARNNPIGIADFTLDVYRKGKTACLYWRPENVAN